MKETKFIDHTVLKATSTKEDVKKLCEEAIKYDFMSVCINPCFAKDAHEFLQGSGVLTCTVIGFPLGANTIATKVFETKDAIQNGAEEIDMVINIGKAKEHDYDYIEEEIRAVVEAANGTLVKVIIETCYLTDEEKVEVCRRAVNAKAHYVKTSTGFGTGGATQTDVKLMKDTVLDKALVKASGGVRTKADFDAMVSAGASRIGTSNGTTIFGGGNNDSNASY